MTKKHTIRPNYLTRKYQRARNLLIEQHGYLPVECTDRKWCYRQLGVLGYLWDTRLQRWETKS